MLKYWRNLNNLYVTYCIGPIIRRNSDASMLEPSKNEFTKYYTKHFLFHSFSSFLQLAKIMANIPLNQICINLSLFRIHYVNTSETINGKDLIFLILLPKYLQTMILSIFFINFSINHYSHGSAACYLWTIEVLHEYTL